MIDALSIDRFNDLVASYGANPDRWPANLCGDAVSCLVRSEAARTAWHEAAELDADLDLISGLETAPELVETVMAIAAAPKRRNNALLAAVLPYAAAAAIALVVGLSVPSPLRDSTVVAPQIQAAVTAPVIDTNTVDINATENGLATLALVDVTAFADDEGNAGDISTGDNSLSSLPLL